MTIFSRGPEGQAGTSQRAKPEPLRTSQANTRRGRRAKQDKNTPPDKTGLSPIEAAFEDLLASGTTRILSPTMSYKGSDSPNTLQDPKGQYTLQSDLAAQDADESDMASPDTDSEEEMRAIESRWLGLGITEKNSVSETVPVVPQVNFPRPPSRSPARQKSKDIQELPVTDDAASSMTQTTPSPNSQSLSPGNQKENEGHDSKATSQSSSRKSSRSPRPVIESPMRSDVPKVRSNSRSSSLIPDDRKRASMGAGSYASPTAPGPHSPRVASINALIDDSPSTIRGQKVSIEHQSPVYRMAGTATIGHVDELKNQYTQNNNTPVTFVPVSPTPKSPASQTSKKEGSGWLGKLFASAAATAPRPVHSPTREINFNHDANLPPLPLDSTSASSDRDEAQDSQAEHSPGRSSDLLPSSTLGNDGWGSAVKGALNLPVSPQASPQFRASNRDKNVPDIPQTYSSFPTFEHSVNRSTASQPPMPLSPTASRQLSTSASSQESHSRPLSSTTLIDSPVPSLRFTTPQSPPRHQDIHIIPSTPDAIAAPSSDAKLAQRYWNEDSELGPRDRYCEFLGAPTSRSNRVLQHYMSHFDMANMRVDFAFRYFCKRLTLRGETQVIDRVLSVFAHRYIESNPGSIMLNANVTHAIAYSILLLNTDLHVADVLIHITRPQYIKNTMNVVSTQINDLKVHEPSSPYGPLARFGAVSSGKLNFFSSASPSVTSSSFGLSRRSNSSASLTSIANNYSQPNRAWQTDLESLLKDIYTAVRAERIVHPAEAVSASIPRASMSSMISNYSASTVSTKGGLPAKTGSFRGLSNLLKKHPSSSLMTSDSTSNLYLQQMREGSPNMPSCGFASTLSKTVQRSDSGGLLSSSPRSSVHSAASGHLKTEDLALRGAPWAKEGLLRPKQLRDFWSANLGVSKPKDKQWAEVFAVCAKDELKLFSFNLAERFNHSRSMVGGGNWTENAIQVGSLSLLHTVSSSMPNGYDKERPYCFVIHNTKEQVHFFAAGTEAHVDEWVNTCNYWAAKCSRLPLQGGVSSSDYGWSSIGDQERHDLSQANKGKTNSVARWEVPLPPSGTSKYSEEQQLERLEQHVSFMKRELQIHLELQTRLNEAHTVSSASAARAKDNWKRKSNYLMSETVKYDRYIDALRTASELRTEIRVHEGIF